MYEYDFGMIDIVKEVQKLDLPKGEYVVIGSGILGALGIREVNDIDLLVTPELFKELRSRGWEYKEVEIEGEVRKKLVLGDAEAFADLWYGDEYQDTNRLIKEAEIIEGVPFFSLDELLKMKRAFGRQKDYEDIQLIEAYESQYYTKK